MGVEPSDAGADQERIDKPAPSLKDGIPHGDERLEAESEFSPLEKEVFIFKNRSFFQVSRVESSNMYILPGKDRRRKTTPISLGWSWPRKRWAIKPFTKRCKRTGEVGCETTNRLFSSRFYVDCFGTWKVSFRGTFLFDVWIPTWRPWASNFW